MKKMKVCPDEVGRIDGKHPRESQQHSWMMSCSLPRIKDLKPRHISSQQPWVSTSPRGHTTLEFSKWRFFQLARSDWFLQWQTSTDLPVFHVKFCLDRHPLGAWPGHTCVIMFQTTWQHGCPHIVFNFWVVAWSVWSEIATGQLYNQTTLVFRFPKLKKYITWRVPSQATSAFPCMCQRALANPNHLGRNLCPFQDAISLETILGKHIPQDSCATNLGPDDIWWS